MSDELTRFRDHCRAMANAGPRDRVPVHDGRGKTITVRGPMGTDADRALWTRLADEIDAYLQGELDLDLTDSLPLVTDVPGAGEAGIT